MPVCKKCRAELPDGASYCPACGQCRRPEKPKRKALKRANGAGTVYKLQGRRRRPWVAAKNRVLLGTYDSKSAAMEALERVAAKDISERYNMTFADVFRCWKEEHYPTVTSAGIATYNRAFDVFASLHDKKFRPVRLNCKAEEKGVKSQRR